MKERTHDSPEHNFYTELQESIWDGLEKDVEGQEAQEQSGENLDSALAVPMYSYEDLNADRQLQEGAQEGLEQQRELAEGISEHPNTTTELHVAENLEPDFYVKQPEKLQTNLEESGEDEEDSDERLSLRERLNERVRNSLNPQRVIANIKDYQSRQKKTESKPKKHKLITRMDKLVLVMIILLGVGYLSTKGQGTQPQGTQTKAQSNSAASSTQASSFKGMGGLDVSSARSQTEVANAFGCSNDPVGDLLVKVQKILSDVNINVVQRSDWLTGTRDAATGCHYQSGGAAFQTDQTLTSTNKSVTTVWTGVDGVVSSLLVIMFIMAGYRVFGGALGFRYAEALEALPRVILATIAALLSLTFVDLVIQLNNDLCQGMLSLAMGVPGYTDVTVFLYPSLHWPLYFIAFFFANVIMFFAGLILALPGIGWIIGGAIVGGFGLIAYVFAFRDVLITVFSIMLAVQLVMRLIMLNVFIILSPLGIACWGFPNRSMQEIARAWCMGFLKLVFVQFIQVTCLAAGMILVPPLNVFDFGAIGANLLAFIGPIAVIWLTVRVPRMLGSAVLGTVEAAGHSVGQAIGGSVVR